MRELQLDRGSLASVQQVCTLFIPRMPGCACLELKDHPIVETGLSCSQAFLSVHSHSRVHGSESKKNFQDWEEHSLHPCMRIGTEYNCPTCISHWVD